MVTHKIKKIKSMLNNKLMKNFLNTNMLMSSNNYNFNLGSTKGNINTLNREMLRTKIIDHFFSPIKALSSKPNYIVTRDKVIINVFYYTTRKKEYGKINLKNLNKLNAKKHLKIKGLNRNTINNLGDLLSKLFDRQVELQFVKLNYPYLNRTILAKYIRHNTNKYKFRRIKGSLFRKRPIVKNVESNETYSMNLPSHIVGMKIKISGRLKTERVRPRKTVSITKIGGFNGQKDLLIEYGSHTSKNKHGAFTVKVWISQKMIP